MIIEWAGRTWEATELPPTAAGDVSRLASSDRQDQLPACVDILTAARMDVEEIVEHVADADDDLDVLDLVAAVLVVGTARPWRSTVGLCRSTVTQWSTIRGRLIDKGIPDPLRTIPSLTALLDVVEVMILDSMDKKDEREKFIRDLYRRETSTNENTPPPGWADGSDLEGLF